MARKIGELLLGPPDVSAFTKAAITTVCMSGTALLGFYCQQKIIEKFYTGEDAELYLRVKAIKQRELQEIARRGGGELAAAAVPQGHGEGAIFQIGQERPQGGWRGDGV